MKDTPLTLVAVPQAPTEEDVRAKKAAWQREYRKAHPERQTKRNQYAEMTPEQRAKKNAKTMARYKALTKKERRVRLEKSRLWQKANPEKLASYVSKWKLLHPEAVRQHHRLRLYGLSQEAFDVLLQSQNGGCAVCRKELKPDRKTNVDHDHETGRVRGLLCHGCNMALGLLGDDLSRLLAAVAYLQRNSK